MSVVGDLVVNLTGNTRPLVASLGSARAAIGTFVAGFGAAFGLHKSVEAFREAEQAGKKLDAALAATGGASGVTSSEIKQLASDLQRVTNFEDDATVAASSLLAKFSNVKGDVFKQAIVSAADLAAATGKDLPSAITLIGKALNDPVRGMALLRKQGVALTAEQEASIKTMVAAGDIAGAQAVVLQNLQSKFGGTAQAMADPLTIVSNLIGDVAESIGSLILPSLQAVAEFIISDIMPGVGTMTEQFGNWGTILAGYVKDALAFVRDSITVIGFAVANIGPIAELAFMNMQLYAIQFGSTVAHFFTGTMPALFDWFLDNWQDVFFTIGDFAATVFINIGQNIRNIMSSAWEFIKSGGTKTLEVAWEPLTRGFVNTIRSLPELPERQASAIEQALIGDIDRLSTDLSDQLGEAMNLAAAEASDRAKPMLPDFSGGGGSLGEIKSMGDVKGAGALQAGSKEALSAIFAGARGASDPQQQLIKLQQDANRLQQDQIDLLEDIAESDMEVVEI